MLHSRFVIARIDVGGIDLPLRMGALVVAARAESEQLDWEVVIHTIDVAEVDQATHDLSLECLAPDLGSLSEIVDDDEDVVIAAVPTVHMSGPAFLVRAVDNALVFRGAGPLHGFDIGDLVG